MSPLQSVGLQDLLDPIKYQADSLDHLFRFPYRSRLYLTNSFDLEGQSFDFEFLSTGPNIAGLYDSGRD